MPYISDEQRRRELTPLSRARDVGELNYQIFMCMKHYLEGKKLSYAEIQNALGSCNEAQHEFRRRILVPYEQLKIAENGDVL